MFTGIVQEIGEIRRVDRARRPARPKTRASKSASRPSRASALEPRRQRLRGRRLPDRRGARGRQFPCRRLRRNAARHDARRQTAPGARVNLEPALARRRQSRRPLGFGARRRRRRGAGRPRATRDRCAWMFAAPAALARYIARKGSVTLDGVSLTVNEVDGVEVQRQPHSAYARSHHARRARAGCARQSRNRPAGALRRAPVAWTTQ